MYAEVSKRVIEFHWSTEVKSKRKSNRVKHLIKRGWWWIAKRVGANWETKFSIRIPFYIKWCHSFFVVCLLYTTVYNTTSALSPLSASSVEYTRSLTLIRRQRPSRCYTPTYTFPLPTYSSVRFSPLNDNEDRDV